MDLLDRQALSEDRLSTRPDLITGRLSNNFEYVLLENDVEKKDFLAHLEVRVGSADEEDNEQGIAHYLEHAVFGGTTQFPSADVIRSVLAEWGMSFGGDTNAFTDFRRTVYTFQAPSTPEVKTANTRDVINMLDQLMFEALIDEAYVDNERNAILSEEQMRNTVDYRSEYHSYQQMHACDILSKRFPIGLVSHINAFKASDLRRFYSKHYTPAKMTLYIVGCFDVDAAKAGILETFGRRGRGGAGEDSVSPELIPFQERFPPIGVSLTRPPKRMSIYRHELIHQFTIHIRQLEPVQSVVSMDQVVENLIDSVICTALDTRVNAWYLKSADPDFTGWNWEFADSHRDECALNNISLSCESGKWDVGLRTGILAVSSLAQLGMSQAEFEHSLKTCLRSAVEEAAQNTTVPHSESLETLMDDINLGCTPLDKVQCHEAMVKAAEFISRDIVNARARDVLSFVLNVDQADSRSFIYVTAPTSLQLSEDEILDVLRAAVRDTPETADVVVPEDLIPSQAILKTVVDTRPHFVRIQQNDDDSYTESSVDVTLDSTLDLSRQLEQQTSITSSTDEVSISSDVSVPDRIVDTETGVIQRRLSNGVCVNYKQCAFDAQQVVIRVSAIGGRVHEPVEFPTGSVHLGIGTVIGSGAGPHSADVLARYASLHQIDVDFNIESERIVVVLRFGASVHDSVMRAFQLLHLYLSESRIEVEAFQRHVREYVVQCEEDVLDAVNVASSALAAALVPGDIRFHSLTPLALNRLTREHCAAAMARELRPHNLEVTIVGDFGDSSVLEHCLLHYLGTLRERAPEDFLGAASPPEQVNRSIESSLDQTPLTRRGPHMSIDRLRDFDVLPLRKSVFLHRHVVDHVSKAVAFVAWPVCNAWGRIGSTGQVDYTSDSALRDAMEANPAVRTRVEHPMFTQRATIVLREVINNRLYKELRERLGHTYAASFHPSLRQYYGAGFNYVTMQMFPDRIDESVQALYQVLQDLKTDITQTDVDEAIKPLAASAQTGLRTTSVWLTLMTDLHSGNVIPKTFDCLHNIPDFYLAMTLPELRAVAAKMLDMDVHCLSIGTSGEKDEQLEGVAESGRALRFRVRQKRRAAGCTVS